MSDFVFLVFLVCCASGLVSWAIARKNGMNQHLWAVIGVVLPIISIAIIAAIALFSIDRSLKKRRSAR